MNYKFDVHIQGDREGICTHITYECLIIRRHNGSTYLMDGPKDIFNDDFFFDGYCLDDSSINLGLLPKEEGKIYKALMDYKCFKCWTDCGYDYDSETNLLAFAEIVLNDVEIQYEIKIDQ